MSKVFIPQEPVHRDWKTGEITPKFDLTPALQYGEAVVMLPSGNVMLSVQPMVNTMTTHLSKYSDDDWILCVGDPIAIGLATAIAAKHNRGRFNMLKWDRKLRKYIELKGITI